MRFALNKEQWDKLCENTDKISSFPTTIGNFLLYFRKRNDLGNFNISFEPKSQTYCVWFDGMLEKFEDKELISAMFNMFCYLEEI